MTSASRSRCWRNWRRRRRCQRAPPPPPLLPSVRHRRRNCICCRLKSPCSMPRCRNPYRTYENNNSRRQTSNKINDKRRINDNSMNLCWFKSKSLHQTTQIHFSRRLCWHRRHRHFRRHYHHHANSAFTIIYRWFLMYFLLNFSLEWHALHQTFFPSSLRTCSVWFSTVLLKWIMHWPIQFITLNLCVYRDRRCL